MSVPRKYRNYFCDRCNRPVGANGKVVLGESPRPRSKARWDPSVRPPDVVLSAVCAECLKR